MYRRLRFYTPVIVSLMVLCAVLVFITLFFDRTLFYISVAVTLLSFAAVIVMLKRTNLRIQFMLREISRGVQASGNGDFTDLPMPAFTVYDSREIIWCNGICESQVFGGRDMRGEDVSRVFGGLDLSANSPPGGYPVSYGGRQYTAFVLSLEKSGENVAVIYLVDDTELKFYADEYHMTKPSIAVIIVDSYEELMQDLKESERAQVMSVIDEEVERYVTENHGFVTRIGRDRHLAVIEEQGMRNIIKNKFGLLDTVREKFLGDKINVTLSIGVSGVSSSLAEAEAAARQALDMCLGRGGDQVAVKTENGYEFFGGVSKGVEKRTKVKTRIIASALNDLIVASGNVVVMGHRFSDLDCLGAALGVLSAVRILNKPCVICLNRETSLAGPLLERMFERGYDASNFADAAKAEALVNDKTLLVVVDTHVPAMLESERVYRACKNVVVIDHHRKLVNHIDNAVIFYHEPYASSASEMVAELVQYIPARPQVTRLEAEAMLSGIMLDTKNFVLKTGVRTFEAAAYLRRLGADTVEVRALFASTMDSYRQRSSIISGAEIYKKCAIAQSAGGLKDISLVAPQAADELMGIAGVDASFVIFETGGGVSVSARSMGAVNVQVIMEKLGGGGHLTMAAAQFKDTGIDKVREMVIGAIDEYNDN